MTLRSILVFLLALSSASVAHAQCSGAGGVPFNCAAGTTPGATDVFLGGSAAGGNTVKWTGAQVAAGVFSLVPTLSGGGTSNFLRADGTWAPPPGGSGATTITGLLKGDGAALSAAIAGTDYLTPNGSGAALTGLTFSQIGSVPTTLSQIANDPAGARAAAGLDAVVATTDAANGTVYGDAQSAVLSVTATSGSPNISFGAPVVTSTTITTKAGLSSITTGTALCSNAMLGQPITITASGLAYAGNIAACPSPSQPTTAMMVTPPMASTLTAAAATITTGAAFTVADQGKSICIGAIGSGVQTGLCSTITTVSSPGAIVLADNAQLNGTRPLTVVWGHDDAAAINAAVYRARSRAGQYPNGAHPYLRVPVKHFVGIGLDAIALAKVDPVGSGEFLPHDDLSYSNSINATLSMQTPGGFLRYVIPTTARAATPPEHTITGPSDFSQFGACAPNCSVVVTGDSIYGNENNTMSAVFSPVMALQREIAAANPGINLTFSNCAVGGSRWQDLDGLANQNDPGNVCIQSLTTPWLGVPGTPGYIFNKQPDLLFIGMQNNATGVANLPYEINVLTKIASWPKVPDLVFGTAHTYGIANYGNNGGVAYESGMQAAMVNRTIARVLGFRVLDLHRSGTRERDGFDPLAMQLIRRYDIPATIPTNWKAPHFKRGYSLSFTALTGGAAFWNSLGDTLYFHAGGAIYGGLARFGINRNTGTGAMSVRCDISTVITYMEYPGLGCVNPATGKPPVTPTLRANLTIASGTPTTLTSSIPLFTAADTGTTFTIPGAGPSTTYAGFATIAEELVTTVTFVNSTTLTLGTAASSFFAARAGVVLRGQPLIPTPWTDNGTTETVQVAINGDSVTAYWNTQGQILYDGPMMRFGENFQPQLSAPSTGAVNLTVALDQNGIPKYATAEPLLNLRSYVDNEISGSYGEAATQFMVGGDGNNHPAAPFAARTVLSTIQAQDWRMPSHAGVQSVASGAAATIAGCQVATVNVNDVTAPTLTLPPSCPANTRMQINDVGGQAAAHVVTIAAPSGLTLTGNATVTTNFGSRTVTYLGGGAAVAQ